MMYVSQIIILYTLNFYNLVCQLDLNKTGGEKPQRDFTPTRIAISKRKEQVLVRMYRKQKTHELPVRMEISAASVEVWRVLKTTGRNFLRLSKFISRYPTKK